MFNKSIKGTNMKNIIAAFMLVSVTLFLVAPGVAADNKYVGVKTCSMCHKAEKTGNQFGVWQKTKHAEAIKTLSSAAAIKIAKEKGLKKPAIESPECLECHAPALDAKLVDKTYDVKDGVQCEICHGAGSAYKSMSVMKDKAKAIAAGLTEYKDQAATEKACKKCHNEKSPSYKEFKFKAMWDKIKHPVKTS